MLGRNWVHVGVGPYLWRSQSGVLLGKLPCFDARTTLPNGGLARNVLHDQRSGRT